MDNNNKPTRVWMVILAAAVISVALFSYKVFDSQTNQSEEAKFGAPFQLIDNKGKPITEQAFEGHPSAVFFGFTHCPEVCPTTLFELASWLEELGEDGKSIQAFFISVDPERDTPQLMNDYVTNFSDRIIGITGDKDEVFKLAKSWFVYWKKVPSEDGDGDYSIDHTASIFLIDKNGKFKGTIAYGEAGETAIEKLRKLANPAGS